MAPRDQERKTGRDPIGPLTHPVRRRILRDLHRCSQPKGAPEVAKTLDESEPQIRYHLLALEHYGTAQEAGSERSEKDSRLYESAVSENPEVLGLLEATEAEDGEDDRKAA
jgi:hypothetical protein